MQEHNERYIQIAIKYGAQLATLETQLDIYVGCLKDDHEILRKSAIVFVGSEEAEKEYRDKFGSHWERGEELFNRYQKMVESVNDTARELYPRIRFAQEYISILRRKLEQLRKVKESVGSDLFDQEFEAYQVIGSYGSFPITPKQPRL